jgi:lauroyl/myristoyl acyltransferase
MGARKGDKENPPPLVTGHDLGFVLGLPALVLAAWLIPERFWKPLARAVAPRAGAILSRSPARIGDCMAALAPETPLALSPQATARELVACEIQKNFQTVRALLWPPWTPRVTLEGEEHILAALEQGKGVVLWDSHLFFGNLMTKVALYGAGYRIHHLSHPRHGFSPSRFGMRFLNPLRAAAESRYLGRRVALSLDGHVAAMRTLWRCVRGNGVVSISVGQVGKSYRDVPFLAGRIRIAAGAPELAHSTGAALIPVFTVQTEDGSYRVTAGEPLAVPEDVDRSEAVTEAIEAYGKRLEPWVRDYPGQWVGWLNV